MSDYSSDEGGGFEYGNFLNLCSKIQPAKPTPMNSESNNVKESSNDNNDQEIKTIEDEKKDDSKSESFREVKTVEVSSSSDESSEEESSSSSEDSSSEDEKEYTKPIPNDQVKVLEKVAQISIKHTALNGETVMKHEKNELPAELCEIQQIKLGDDVKMNQVGYIINVIDDEVATIQGNRDEVINLDSWVFLANRQSLGKVTDVFGQVNQPMYAVVLEQVDVDAIKPGCKVFCAPDKTDLTQYVFPSELKKLRGSDASWMKDAEPPAHMLDYSGDEEEREVKKARRRDHQQQATTSPSSASPAIRVNNTKNNLAPRTQHNNMNNPVQNNMNNPVQNNMFNPPHHNQSFNPAFTPHGHFTPISRPPGHFPPLRSPHHRHGPRPPMHHGPHPYHNQRFPMRNNDQQPPMDQRFGPNMDGGYGPPRPPFQR